MNNEESVLGKTILLGLLTIGAATGIYFVFTGRKQAMLGEAVSALVFTGTVLDKRGNYWEVEARSEDGGKSWQWVGRGPTTVYYGTNPTLKGTLKTGDGSFVKTPPGATVQDQVLPQAEVLINDFLRKSIASYAKAQGPEGAVL